VSSSTKRLSNPFGGPARYVTEGLVDALMTYCAIKGIRPDQLYVIQGSNNVGVVKSAGTHDGNSCVDTLITVDDALLKKIGVMSQERTPAQGFDPHSHMVLMYAEGLAWLAEAQEKAYRERRSNGLGDLSHLDTSWCPRYRGVRHVKGPASYKGVKKTALRDTYAYLQAGCDPKYDGDLVKRKLSRGTTVTDIVGRVECQSKDYYVTRDASFILVTDLGAHAGDKVTIQPDNTIYVTTTATVGYAQPDLASPAKVNVAAGARITGNGQAKTSKTFVRNTQGFWFLRQDLDVRKAKAPKPKPTVPPIVGLRVGTLNLPDDTKVPQLRGETTRAGVAAAQIEAAGLHLVFLQELVGPIAGKPSAWAAKVLKALGSSWGLVVGRTGFNENYIAYRKAVFNVSQLDDIIIRVADLEGKHGTPAVFTHEASGRELLGVCTHLVANNEAGAGKQGSFLGPKVRELAAGRVTIVGGDMNTNGMLSGFANTGLKNTRKSAVRTDNSATYTNQSKSKPSTSVEDIIDQIWVSEKGVTVTRHEVVSATSGGEFIEPRVGDHMLTWAELTIA
jgi:hypothetical protein